MKGDLRYWQIQEASVPGYNFACVSRDVSYKYLVNFRPDVRLAHGLCSEAVGNMGFEDVATPWSLKGECSNFWVIW